MKRTGPRLAGTTLVLACSVLAACTLVRDWSDLRPGGPEGDAGSSPGSADDGAPDVDAPAPVSLGGAIRWRASCASATADATKHLAFNTEPFTIELWYAPERVEIGLTQLHVSKGGTSVAYPGWGISGYADTLGLSSNNGMENASAAVGGYLKAFHKYHVVATRNANRAELWVLDATAGERVHRRLAKSDSFATWNNTRRFTIGSSSSTTVGCASEATQGVLDEIRIWNVVRAPEAFDADFDRPVPCNSPGLVGYWNLDERSGIVVGDCTGRADLVINEENGDSAPPKYEWVASPFP